MAPSLFAGVERMGSDPVGNLGGPCRRTHVGASTIFISLVWHPVRQGQSTSGLAPVHAAAQFYCADRCSHQRNRHL